jgi:hypothetical protein
MRLRGEDVEEGLRGWIKSELSDGPKQSYELGRFLFSVTLGTAGLFVAIGELREVGSLSAYFGWALFLLLLSAAPALDLAMPKAMNLGGSTDLVEAYNTRVKLIKRHLLAWLALWLIGTILGAASLTMSSNKSTDDATTRHITRSLHRTADAAGEFRLRYAIRSR